MSLNKMSIKQRLILGFAVAPAIMVVLIVVGVFQVNEIDHGLTAINDINGVKQRYAINFRGSVHDRAIALRDIVLESGEKEIAASLNEIKKLESFYTDAEKNLGESLKENLPSEDEKKLIQEIESIQSTTLPIIQKVIELKEQNLQEEAHAILMTQAKPAFIKWLYDINQYIDHLESLNTIEAKNSRTIASSFQEQMILLTLLGVGASIIAAFILIRSISKALTTVASEIDTSSTEITNVSRVISTLGNSLEAGSSKQASSIEGISSAVEELSAVVKKNVEYSDNAAEIANESKNAATVGSQVVGDMLKAIDEINQSNENIMVQITESNRQMGEIVKVIAEIGTKTTVINDIVFQTKLLSFNASVEAARAGEHGKGFAVVAEEVGKLAQLSGNSAQEISSMLEQSSQKVEAIVMETQNRVANLVEIGKGKVNAGVMVAHECESVLSQIVEKVSTVTGMANEISLSSKEQSIGFEQISKNVFEMDAIIKQNSTLANQTAKTLGTLNEQSHEMRSSFESLSRLIKGA